MRVELYDLHIDIEHHSLILATDHHRHQHFLHLPLQPHQLLTAQHRLAVELRLRDLDVEVGLQLGDLAIEVRPVEGAEDLMRGGFVAGLEVLSGHRVQRKSRDLQGSLDLHFIIIPTITKPLPMSSLPFPYLSHLPIGVDFPSCINNVT